MDSGGSALHEMVADALRGRRRRLPASAARGPMECAVWKVDPNNKLHDFPYCLTTLASISAKRITQKRKDSDVPTVRARLFRFCCFTGSIPTALAEGKHITRIKPSIPIAINQHQGL